MNKQLTGLLLVFRLCVHAQTAAPYNVVIDEIMADPTPVIGLPNTEYIELRNVSAQAFNLKGWRLGDASSSAVISTNVMLKPDSFVIICSSSAAALLNNFGTVLSVSNFPSLNNDGDELYLRSEEGRTIHAVAYNAAWYRNAVKGQGGWSLEMIDPRNPCSGAANWTASNDNKGGTPGKKNSVDGILPDQEPPALLRAFATDNIHITITFNEPLDSLPAARPANYTISNGIGPAEQAAVMGPVFDQVQLRTGRPLAEGNIYTVTATAITDCAGNAIGGYNRAAFGLAGAAAAFDLVINELLFHPKPDGADYLELYNRSNTIIDLYNCYLANRVAGIIGSVKQISATHRVLLPGNYLVITADLEAVQKQYLAKDPAAFAVIGTMPSFPDDKGAVVLLDAQGAIIDELDYDEHWQFPLISNNEGVALERIDYNNPTQDPANWHSAATSAGYGTPGYQNSQVSNGTVLPGTISVAPAIFSPDNDGHDDFLTIQYQFPEAGYVCNLTVLNAAGRPVRYLARNALCGRQGYFRWDGLDENMTQLPIGVYVIFADLFNLKGKTSHFKQAVTLARRL